MEKEKSKSKKEVRDDKLKDQKLEEQLLGELSNGSPEEKLRLLLGKHIDSERANRRLKQDTKAQEKLLEGVLREKENLQREYNKSVLMRDKLQEVCREQQKIIKSMKNESLAKLREEEERRKESQTKFQISLNEINQSLSKNNEENLKLRDHNIEMTKKLKFLAEQYQVREQQLEKLNEQIQLESQLQQAKLSKVQVEAAMEKEILIKEKQIALERLAQTHKVIKELSDRELALKEQLNLYTSKYDDFQSSLQKSNDIFATYKVELDKMSKNTKKLEKESLEWKRKWEKSNATLIELATEKQERDEHAARCTKQVDQLQKLLRALQHERTHLYKVLRENNVECPAMPELPPEPAMLKTNTSAKEKEDKDKMEMMSKNCAEIKQTLASLQSQIKTLKLKENEANSLLKMENVTSAMKQQQQDETLKRQQKKKKSKSKNNKNKETVTPTEPTETNESTEPTEPIEPIESIEPTESKVSEVTPPAKETTPTAVDDESKLEESKPIVPAEKVEEQIEGSVEPISNGVKESVVEQTTSIILDAANETIVAELLQDAMSESPTKAEVPTEAPVATN